MTLNKVNEQWNKKKIKDCNNDTVIAKQTINVTGEKTNEYINKIEDIETRVEKKIKELR